MSKSTVGVGAAQSSTTSDAHGRPENGPRVIGTAIAFAVVYVLSIAAIRWDGLPPGWKVPVALLPAPVFAAFMWALIRGARALDELQVRIQLEALAFAFPGALLVLFTLGLLERVLVLPPDDLSYRHVWAMMPLLYFAGLTMAQRRYR